jgi:hypothetical protein
MENQNTLTAVPNTGRRDIFTQALGGAIIAAAGGTLLAAKAAHAQAITDADILNFALNLEYLEAEFYTLATRGVTIEQLGVLVTGVGTAGGVTVKPNPRVSFTDPLVRQLAEEVAADERAHVVFLRGALGSAAVARPAIDLVNSFNIAAQAAGIPGGFDPFANETNFLLGAFIFEDVGVTAYKGAARLIQNRSFLVAAAGILGTEAYHAGAIRTRVYQAGPQAQQLSQLISNLRDTLDGGGDQDQGVAEGGTANVVPTDANGIAFSRTASQVLKVVYANSATGISRGGFFPSGVNGRINTTAAL